MSQPMLQARDDATRCGDERVDCRVLCRPRFHDLQYETPAQNCHRANDGVHTGLPDLGVH